MLTPERRHYQDRANKRIEARSKFAFGWCGKRGKYYKRRLNKAWRAFFKARLRGNRGKEPVTLTSEVNWRGS